MQACLICRMGGKYEQWSRSRSWRLLVDRPRQWYVALKALLGGVILLVALIGLAPLTLRDRRMRLPLICMAAVVCGSFLQVVYYAHYAAPAAVVVILLLMQGLRHLRLMGGVGLALARAIPAAALMVMLGSQAGRLYRQETPEQTQPVNARRDKLEERLRSEGGGRHVILVRYTGRQSPHEEWVYNRADIDAANVVWAHDMGSAKNGELIRYFRGRRIWLLEPDKYPEQLSRYP